MTEKEIKSTIAWLDDMANSGISAYDIMGGYYDKCNNRNKYRIKHIHPNGTYYNSYDYGSPEYIYKYQMKLFAKYGYTIEIYAIGAKKPLEIVLD